MSYHSHAGYGGYYGNQNNSQSNAAVYNDGRDAAGSSTYGQSQTYQNATHENQYGSHSYDWSSQTQQSYPEPTNVHSTTNTGWRNGDGQGGSYDYRRQANEQGAQYGNSSDGQMAMQRNAPSSATASTQGLNQLAYASGLDNQRPASTQSHGYPTSNTASNTAAVSTNANRAKSPNYANSYQTAAPRATSYPVQKEDGAGTSQLAMSAAAALAGAVSRRNQNAQMAATNATNAAAGLTRNSTATPPVRTKSPYTTTAQPQAQVRQDGKAQSTQKPSYSNTTYPVKTTYNTKPVTNQSTPTPQHARTSSTSQHPSPNPSTQQPTSWSGAVSQPVSETVRKNMQLPVPEADMPAPAVTYIDPFKVFNPYHHEHERRKREQAAAAEAEEAARRIAEVQAQKDAVGAAEAGKHQKTDKNASQTPKQVRSEGRPKGQIRKKEKAAANTSTQNAAPTTRNDSEPTSSAADIAAEMKRMMDRMQELRNQDPTLFQKMLESSGGDLSTSLASPPPKAKRQSKPPLGLPEEGSIYHPPNGWRVVVENNPEGLPDLGRFPAERRLRPKHKTQQKLETAVGASPVATGTAPVTTAPNTGYIAAPLPPQTSLPAQTLPPAQPPALLITTQAMAPSIPASKTVTSPQGGTVWPEERRKTLAEVAVRTLKSNHENISILINVNDVQTILAKNPSYSELCEILEKRGLKFNRAQFARQLLSSMPDLTQQAKGASPNMGSVGQNLATSLSTSQPVVTSIVAAAGTPMVNASQAMGVLIPSTMVVKNEAGEVKGATVKAGKSKSRQSGSAQNTSKNEPAAGSKEAMSRKRDFSEIVDLTNLSDTEDYVLSRKQPRIEDQNSADHMLTPSQPPPPMMMASTSPHAAPLPTQAGSAFQSTGVQPLKFNPVPTAPAQKPARTPWVPPQKILVSKAVDAVEGKKKTLYNPKTLARDVLLAVGEHPTMPALNNHLFPLCKHHAWLDHDMSTFDWEAVDPGGPAPPKVEIEEIPVAWPRMRTMQYGEQNAPKLDSVKRRYDAPAPAPDHTRGQHKHADPAQTGVDMKLVNARLQQEGMRNFSIATPSMTSTGEKRRGRPPGSKNRPKDTQSTLPPSDAQSPAPMHQIFKCKWRKCHAQLHNLLTLRLHIAKMHSPNAEQIASDGGYVCWWKKCPLFVQKGEEVVVEKVFKTQEEWVKHINDEHVHPIGLKYGDGPSTSHIGKPVKTSSPNSKTVNINSPDPNKSNLRTRSSTIDPHDVAADRERYLSDDLGRPVTTQVTQRMMKDLPPDPLDLSNKTNNETQIARRGFLKAHHTDKSSGKLNQAKVNALETLRAMEARKLKIGPGIDRGGCTLVNEARRSTFVQKPGISRVVDGNY